MTIALVLPLLVSLAGCISPMAEKRNEDVRQKAQVSSIKTDQARLREQLHGMEDIDQDIYRRMEKMEKERAAGEEDMAKRVEILSAQLRALEAQRAQDRQELIDTLSRKMAEIMGSRAPAATPGSSTYLEHTVKQGETISEIAVAYGVTVGAIVRANELGDANSIRVGKKLLIPE